MLYTEKPNALQFSFLIEAEDFLSVETYTKKRSGDCLLRVKVQVVGERWITTHY